MRGLFGPRVYDYCPINSRIWAGLLALFISSSPLYIISVRYPIRMLFTVRKIFDVQCYALKIYVRKGRRSRPHLAIIANSLWFWHFWFCFFSTIRLNWNNKKKISLFFNFFAVFVFVCGWKELQFQIVEKLTLN